MQTILESLLQRRTVFGIPVRFLTQEKIDDKFEPEGEHSFNERFAHAVGCFAEFIEREFSGFDVYMPPAGILAFTFQRHVGEEPTCMPQYTNEQINNLSENKDPKPYGVIVFPGGRDNVGARFLNNFTKAPEDTYWGFNATDDEWKIMQICHEIGHGLGSDEVRADTCGMLAYYSLTDDKDFFMDWHNARLLKSLFNPEGYVDFKAAVTALSLVGKINQGTLPALSLDDKSIPAYTEVLMDELTLNTSAYKKFRRKFFELVNRRSKYTKAEELSRAAQEIFQDESSDEELKEVAARYVIAFLYIEKQKQDKTCTHSEMPATLVPMKVKTV